MLTSFCDPDGARTHDHLIKSQVLYRLSYGIGCFKKRVQRYYDLILKTNTLHKKMPMKILISP